MIQKKFEQGGLGVVLLLFLVPGVFAFGCMRFSLRDGGVEFPEVTVQTTDPQIAVQNLNAQIAGFEKQLRRQPRSIDARVALAGRLLERTLLLGTYAKDFARLEQLTHEAMEIDPSSEKSKLLFAQVSSAFHLFGRAKEVLNEMHDPRRENPEIRGLLHSIAVATGDDLSEVATEQRARVAARPSFVTFVDLAITEAALGNFEEADRLYESALALYRDSSPFPLAIVSFQRGVMWCEMANRCDRAMPFYQEAVKRVPGYVNANVHLAELEAQRGMLDASIARLRLIQNTSDPEPAGLLSELLIQKGETSQAQPLIEQAREGYLALLSRYEEAFRDHATEFFLSQGNDKDLALRLAKANLENRKDDRAYLLALEAGEKNGQLEYICGLVKEISARRKPTSLPLIEMLAKVSPRCE